MQTRDLHRPQKPLSPLAACLQGGCLLLVLGLGYLLAWFVSGRWNGVARHTVVVGVMLGVGVLGEFVRYRRRSRT